MRAYNLLFDALGPNTPGYRDLQGILKPFFSLLWLTLILSLGGNTTGVAWTLVEIVAALVGCCLPTLRPLFTDTFLGGYIRSIFSAIPLRSRGKSSAQTDEDDGKLAVVSIGGRELKRSGLLVKEKEDSACSVELNDVGRLA
jgi:hypothetical protein